MEIIQCGKMSLFSVDSQTGIFNIRITEVLNSLIIYRILTQMYCNLPLPTSYLLILVFDEYIWKSKVNCEFGLKGGCLLIDPNFLMKGALVILSVISYLQIVQ